MIFLQVLRKFSFQKEDWALGNKVLRFLWYFLLPKILSLKSIKNSLVNSYIQAYYEYLVSFHLWWKKNLLNHEISQNIINISMNKNNFYFLKAPRLYKPSSVTKWVRFTKLFAFLSRIVNCQGQLKAIQRTGKEKKYTSFFGVCSVVSFHHF